LGILGVGGQLSRLGVEEARAASIPSRPRCAPNRDCCGYPNRKIVCNALPVACGREGDRCCGRSDASCASQCDCCRGLACSGGRCRVGDGDGGCCGGSTCQSGWTCCTMKGVSPCIDRDDLQCCRSAMCQRAGLLRHLLLCKGMEMLWRWTLLPGRLALWQNGLSRRSIRRCLSRVD